MVNVGARVRWKETPYTGVVVEPTPEELLRVKGKEDRYALVQHTPSPSSRTWYWRDDLTEVAS